jgi:hypothetical protein
MPLSGIQYFLRKVWIPARSAAGMTLYHRKIRFQSLFMLLTV